MSNSALTNLGLKAMQAQFAGLQTTGHNIANANVKGYSRQEIALATTPGQFRDGAFYGRGVDVQGVSRSHDAWLTVQACTTSALAAMDSARLQQLQGLEGVFQTGENGLGDAASQFFKSMVDVSNQPADLASRRVALARASDLALRFRDAGGALDTLQAGVSTALAAAVTEINGLTASIAGVNQQIAVSGGMSQLPNDLLDQRDTLVAQLATKIRIDRIDNADGGVSISIAGGQPLVLGASATRLSLRQNADDPTRSALAVDIGGLAQPLDENTLGGGAVAGLLQFQNQDLMQGRNLIGQLAAALGAAVNAQQQRGVSLQPPLGQAAGSPCFDIGAAQALANARNARGSNGLPIGSVTLTITDASMLKASDYALESDGAGAWKVTRLSDGVERTVNSGGVVDGMRIDVNNAQGGDRFLLQPVARAANGMRALLNDPRDLAAAAPLVASTPGANIGSARISSLQVTAVPLPNPGATVKVTFTDDNGGYDWGMQDGSGNALPGGGSGSWGPGLTLPPAGTDFNGFALTLDGVPRSGDVLLVAPTGANGVATNNGNALALMGLRDALLVDGRNVTDSYAQALADIGVRVQSSRTTSTISQAVAQQSEVARSAQSGVNLDEEAARLITYQQGYQAAAKVLTVAQSIFDTLLQATAR